MKCDKVVSWGDIWTVDLGKGIGSEHSGVKYCLVIQNDIGNEHSGTTVVIPITKEQKNMPTHLQISNVLPVTSYIICEQIRVIDKARLQNKYTKLNSKTMALVGERIKLQLNIR